MRLPWTPTTTPEEPMPASDPDEQYPHFTDTAVDQAVAHATAWHQDPATTEIPVIPGPGGRTCPNCGAPVPSEFQLLNDSLALVEPRAEDLIGEFYHRLFQADDTLRALFPDLPEQRNRLLGAIVALAQNFNPADPAAMGRLHGALDTFGQSHARPDLAGEVTLDRYAAVGNILIQTLADYAGTGWNRQTELAWRHAYAYTQGGMIQRQTLAEMGF